MGAIWPYEQRYNNFHAIENRLSTDEFCGDKAGYIGSAGFLNCRLLSDGSSFIICCITKSKAKHERYNFGLQSFSSVL